MRAVCQVVVTNASAILEVMYKSSLLTKLYNAILQEVEDYLIHQHIFVGCFVRWEDITKLKKMSERMWSVNLSPVLCCDGSKWRWSTQLVCGI